MRLRSPSAFIVVTALIVLALLAFSPSPSADAPMRGDRPAVAATLFPVFDIVRSVAGDAVEVRLLLPSGASPHTFEPSPSTLRGMDGVDAVYAVGHGLDGWVDSLAASLGTDVMTLDAGIALHEEEPDEAGDGEPDHEGADPHYWLAVENARTMARNAATDLATRFPNRAGDFAVNLATFESRLDALRSEMEATLSGVTNRSLVTMHDAWYYFAEENGFDLVATVTTSPGKELTPHQLTALTRAVADNGVTAIYSEPQLSTSAILPFAKDYGLAIAVLDPLGGIEENASYAELMLDNARVVAANQR